MMADEQANELSHVRCKVIIEVLGKPKHHVDKTIKDYVEKIRSDSTLVILNEHFSDPEEKDDLFAIFTELELVIKGLPALVAFCFEYMPSSVEIIKPRNFSLDGHSLEDFINNLQARLHQVDMIVKKLRNENVFLKKNLNTAAKNSILLSLSKGPMDAAKLSRITGINEKELSHFITSLVSEGKIRQQEGGAFLISHATVDKTN